MHVAVQSLVLDFCDDALIEGITILNSKFFHLNIYECKGSIRRNKMGFVISWSTRHIICGS
jgi:hypothetical protein